MPEMYVSWSEYRETIERLAAKIYRSGWQFDSIICIAKGGLRVGDVLCRLYHCPLAVLSAASYHGEENRLRGEIIFSAHLSMTTPSVGKRVLLVDDLVDSGVSLVESIKWLQQKYETEIEEIRSAVLWYKACSAIAPDYYVQYLSDNPWIHQPFEYYEKTNIAELADRYEAMAMAE
ncbi:MAG: phosphoribosyltransferase [Cyanobacteria bacterium P01_E01_bin.42]